MQAFGIRGIVIEIRMSAYEIVMTKACTAPTLNKTRVTWDYMEKIEINKMTQQKTKGINCIS